MKHSNIYGVYMPRYNKHQAFYRIFKDNWYPFLSGYYSHPHICEKYGDLSEYQIDTVDKFLKCNDLKQGFGIARCPKCGTTYVIPFSCKKHKICPTCKMKKLLEYSEWLKQEVLLNLTHRHWVFTMPVELRTYFFQNRYLLNKLIETACQFLVFLYRKYSLINQDIKKLAHPGIVGVLQTAGSNLTWNPHVHIISTDGLLIEQENGDKIYQSVRFIPYNYIRIAWRNRVLNMLVNFKIISKQQREWLKKRYPKGFIIHGVIKDTIHDRDVKVRLCQYMQRGLIGDKNIIYYSKYKQLVVIKYKYNNKPKTERMHVYEFMARILQHIDPVAINTRYYGVYSNLLRHKWRKQGIKPNKDSKGVYRKDFSMNWRNLIYKIYEVDPLICIKCGMEMELQFLVDAESAKWELKRLRKMKYYYLGRWSDLPPPFINAA